MVCGCKIFFFNDTATTEIYTLSLLDALPICSMKVTSCDGDDVLGATHACSYGAGVSPNASQQREIGRAHV